MVMVGEGCEGTSCQYFRRFYGVQPTNRYKTVFMPDFSIVDEYCSHPDIYVTKPAKEVDHTGVRLQAVKHCPIKCI